RHGTGFPSLRSGHLHGRWPCHRLGFDATGAQQRTGAQCLSRGHSQKSGHGMKLLEIKDLYGGYGGGDILKGVSLNMDARDIVAIVGPNGAGKSTLMKSAFGLVQIRSGQVNFDGKDITRLSPDKVV